MNKLKYFIKNWVNVFGYIYREVLKVKTSKDVKELPYKILYNYNFFKEYGEFNNYRKGKQEEDNKDRYGADKK